MTRWFSLALVFVLGAVAGWTALAIGASKSQVNEARSGAASDPAQIEALRDLLVKKIPELKRENIQPSPIAGVYEVQRGHLFGYVSADGRYLIQGDLVDMEKGEEITENRRRVDRLAALKSLGNNYIEFAPTPPIATKYTVNVFIDIDCGYCRKLHNDMAGYNAQGIAVRYLFFPRSGPNTESFYKAQTVWCSADRRDAVSRLNRGETIATSTKCENPVLKQFKLGEDLGVHGTPAMVLPNGDLFPGYVPPTQLAALLASAASPALGIAAPAQP